LLEEDPLLSPEVVREKLIQRASKNHIEDLSPVCANEFLYVGSDGPEPNRSRREDPWPSDEFFGSCEAKGEVGPRGDYPVCMCALRADWNENGTVCYNGDTNEPGCPLGAALEALDASPRYSHIDLSLYFFLWNCTTCMCRQSPPVPDFSPESTKKTTFGIIGTSAVLLSCVAMFTLARKKTGPSTLRLEMTEVP